MAHGTPPLLSPITGLACIRGPAAAAPAPYALLVRWDSILFFESPAPSHGASPLPDGRNCPCGEHETKKQTNKKLSGNDTEAIGGGRRAGKDLRLRFQLRTGFWLPKDDSVGTSLPQSAGSGSVAKGAARCWAWMEEKQEK